jgi:glucose/mannose transport system substrate-binding protein
MRKVTLSLVLLALLLLIGSAFVTAQESGELEIFSWWTAGGEVEALNALYAIYNEQYPGVEIVNAALAGGQGQGGNMKALLETRMLGGEPPDSFQVHLGRELIDSHVIAGRMEPLGWFYEEEGLNDVFPPGLVEIASYEGEPYSVPVNIHRSNVMWYRPSRLAEVGVTEPPATWEEFFTVAEQLKEAGIPAIAIADQDSGGGFSGHVFENILLSVMGPDKYKGLFDGTTGWDDADVTASLEIMNRLYDYANPDYLSTSWGDINDRFVSDDGPAMMVMGDWTHGVLMSMGFEDYHWTTAPGTDGLYNMLSDSFGLPLNAPDRENAVNFLRVVASQAGQDAFNVIKGSIPARTDADRSLYDEYLLGSMDAWGTDVVVPSIQHGAAAKQSFLVDYDIALADLGTNRDVAKAQQLLVDAAAVAAFGQ